MLNCEFGSHAEVKFENLCNLTYQNVFIPGSQFFWLLVITMISFLFKNQVHRAILK